MTYNLDTVVAELRRWIGDMPGGLRAGFIWSDAEIRRIFWDTVYRNALNLCMIGNTHHIAGLLKLRKFPFYGSVTINDFVYGLSAGVAGRNIPLFHVRGEELLIPSFSAPFKQAIYIIQNPDNTVQVEHHVSDDASYILEPVEGDIDLVYLSSEQRNGNSLSGVTDCFFAFIEALVIVKLLLPDAGIADDRSNLLPIARVLSSSIIPMYSNIINSNGRILVAAEGMMR